MQKVGDSSISRSRIEGKTSVECWLGGPIFGVAGDGLRVLRNNYWIHRDLKPQVGMTPFVTELFMLSPWFIRIELESSRYCRRTIFLRCFVGAFLFFVVSAVIQFMC